jgi:release factor glutamine methyltransferase
MDRERALIDLGHALRASEYQFVTVTPATHARKNARRRGQTDEPGMGSPVSLRDIFGWSLPFPESALPPSMFELLGVAGALGAEADGLFRSRVRFSSLGGELFVHSAYPTSDADAVFFGPDTYRFCAAIGRARLHAQLLVDVGCGSGAGGIVACRAADRVILADVNDEALTFARVNAALARVQNAQIVYSDVLASVDAPMDAIVANPPYMRDDLHRTYRDGGGQLGEGLSLRIVEAAVDRLSPGGILILYTGAPIVLGHDIFLDAATPLLRRGGMAFHYEEIDPDVFGEELEKPGYAAVERIAAVVLTATKSSA